MISTNTGSNAKQLFTNLWDLKQIDEGFDDLAPEQMEAIRMFREHFQSGGDGSFRQEHTVLWELLWDTYTRFPRETPCRGIRGTKE